MSERKQEEISDIKHIVPAMLDLAAKFRDDAKQHEDKTEYTHFSAYMVFRQAANEVEELAAKVHKCIRKHQSMKKER